jgi:hypothetical protein
MQQRTLIGIAGLVLFAIGGGLTLNGATGAMAAECQASSLKFAVLCGLVWLAYPELIKLPGWAFPALFCALLAAYRWRWFFVLVPILAAVGWLLKPRGKDSATRSRRPRPEPGQPRDA